MIQSNWYCKPIDIQSTPVGFAMTLKPSRICVWALAGIQSPQISLRHNRSPGRSAVQLHICGARTVKASALAAYAEVVRRWKHQVVFWHMPSQHNWWVVICKHLKWYQITCHQHEFQWVKVGTSQPLLFFSHRCCHHSSVATWAALPAGKKPRVLQLWLIPGR